MFLFRYLADRTYLHLTHIDCSNVIIVLCTD